MVPLGGLKYLGYSGEAGVVHDQGEGVGADCPLSDMFMAVDPAVKSLLRVIEVKALQAVDADETIKFFPDSIVGISLVKIITGGEGVAGIVADAETLRIGRTINDCP